MPCAYFIATVRETKFLEHSAKNRCPLYALYKIPLAQANFFLTQLKMHSHWRTLVSLTGQSLHGNLDKNRRIFLSNLNYDRLWNGPQASICHIYASVNVVSIGSDNGLSLIRHQAIIQTNAGLLSIRPLETNFSEILIMIQNFSFTKMHLKILFAKLRPFCPGGDELIYLEWISRFFLPWYRYTANDPCHPRCNFLYKDHYHCNKGCGMIFKAKDGVREHAR